mmetsp:Transcript_29889/g.72870  ORF Transcript_29889/g.72870 Transcript_29889/m.72870 type:complete len:394 (-) Transcript_29889:109-1290(-)
MGLGRRREGASPDASVVQTPCDSTSCAISGPKEAVDDGTLAPRVAYMGAFIIILPLVWMLSREDGASPSTSIAKESAVPLKSMSTSDIHPLCIREKLVLKRVMHDFAGATYVLRVGDELLVSGDNQIQRVSILDGKKLGKFLLKSEHTLANPTGLALSEDGEDLIVGEQGGRGLKKVRIRNGELIGNTGGGHDKLKVIDSALGVAVGDGRIYVADVTAYRVTAYNNVNIDNGEILWVFNQTQINSKLKKSLRCKKKRFRRNTAYKGPSCLNPHGVAFSPVDGGRIFVSDADNNVIFKLDANTGAIVRTIHGVRGVRDFNTPRGVAVAGMGQSSSLVVAERHELLVLTLDGELRSMQKIPGAKAMLGVTSDEERENVYIADVPTNSVFVLKWAK